MKIGIINFEHSLNSTVFGPYDILNETEFLCKYYYPDVKQISLDTKIIDGNKLPWDENFNLIIIPAMPIHKIKVVLSDIIHINDWLHLQKNNGAEIASICLGAFILASSGLADHLEVTTHWAGESLFQKMFPKVNLKTEKLVVENAGVYSSGGVYAYTYLILYILEKYFGKEVATIISNAFLIKPNQANQNLFKVNNMNQHCKYEEISYILGYIKNNLDLKLSNSYLAEKINLSNRTFLRRFKESTGSTPRAYIKKVKVEKAKNLLLDSNYDVEEISYKLGYKDLTTFRNAFKLEVGMTPTAYKKSIYKADKIAGNSS